MKISFIYNFYAKRILITSVLLFVFFSVFSQPPLPNRTITVTATQAIHFGTFCVTGGAGGTVTVGFDGSRTSTGSVVLLPIAPISQPAIFEVKLCQGRNVAISFEPTAILTGSNGGFLTLDIGPTENGFNGAIFTTKSDCNFITPLRVGGTLHIPGTAIPGIYSGTFNITFDQE
jgi:hypothetical protein